MAKRALRLGMALALSAGLGGVALAQQSTATGTATAPGQMQQPQGGMPAPAQMQQPQGAMPAPATPGNGSAMSNPGNPEAAAPNPGMQYGHQANLSSNTVKQAQRQLKSEGLYHGMIDGRFGPETRAAVREFQQKNGLTTNAMLDQQTLQRLMGNHHG